MKVTVFSTKPYDYEFISTANSFFKHKLVFLEPRLTEETAALAKGSGAVCIFVNDQITAPVLSSLASDGVRLIALRCAGFNNVDLQAARDLDVTVVRVPEYSPYAVAEHAAGLLLTLNRQLHRAYNRVREGNFTLQGLLGFDLHGRTVGIVGTGKIGTCFARIMRGFGCHILAHDPQPNGECEAMDVEYVPLPQLLRASDVISLHCPLLPQTHHIINAKTIENLKHGVMIINTGRGALIDTRAAITGLKSGKIGYLGLDVYEEEGNLFFEDFSSRIIEDDVFTRLLTFPNVLITGHQGFFTREALERIAHTTLTNITAFERGEGEIYKV